MEGAFKPAIAHRHPEPRSKKGAGQGAEIRTALTDPAQANIVVSDPPKQASGGGHQIGIPGRIEIGIGGRLHIGIAGRLRRNPQTPSFCAHARTMHSRNLAQRATRGSLSPAMRAAIKGLSRHKRLRPHARREIVPITFKRHVSAARGVRRLSGLNLAAAAIILWNTVYLARAVDELRSRGEVIPEEFLSPVVAPLGWEHIAFNGDYVWPDESLAIAFRPLRNPRIEFLETA
jgi:hypothetical protein